MKPLLEMQKDLTEAVEKISKSVVVISSLQIRSDRYGDMIPMEGNGTGILIGHSGYVVTNNHVVANGHRLNVTLSDGRTFEGKVIGSDPVTDVALLRIKAWDLPVAELGDSEEIKVGQIVLAVGNALGLPGSPTVSMGVVSALGRPLPWSDFIFEGLIQTDAAINPGNSGGPLCSIEGKVLGINTAMVPFAQGVGFAIPIDTVKRVMQQILEHGRVVRAYLGISGISVDKQIARRFETDAEDGVLVAKISRNGPAYAGGIRVGDVIHEIGGNKVTNMKDLLKALSSEGIGTEVKVKHSRNGEMIVSNILLAETPEEYLQIQR
jgi:S1-C subfamily serine protease